MGGSTKVIDTTNPALKPLHNAVSGYLMGNPSGSNGGASSNPNQNFLTNLFGQATGMNAAGVPAGGTQPNINMAGPGGFNLGEAMGGAPSPQSVDPMGRIMGTAVGSNAPTAVPYGGNGAGVNYQSADPLAMPDRASVRDVSLGQNGQDMFSLIMQRLGGGGPQAQAGSTQSVDQLGSATSGFFNNMMNQYKPAFAQARTESLAGAKESMGNLTGSGAGNALGAAANRSMGAEQAQLAELAKWGVGQEMQRQLGQAGLDTNASIANANNQGQMVGMGINALGQQMQAGASNQNADLSFLDQLSRLGINNQNTQQQTNMAQGNSELQQALQNQQLFQGTLNQGSAQGVQQGQFNAGQQNNMNAQNAQNFLQMVMGQLGNNNVAVQQNPGVFGSILGTVAPLAGAFLGGPGGAALGKKVGLG